MAERQYKYTVQGSSDFPWDMLRYDRVWPLDAPTPYRFASDKAWRQIRTVEVAGHGCTPARWASFGWQVLDADNAVWGMR